MSRTQMARLVAIWDAVLILALIALLALYWRAPWDWIRDLKAEDPLGGVMPLIVPWSGSLGGLTISLIGAAAHSQDWDSRWNLWHATRFILGAVAGCVAFLIVVLVLKLAGDLEDDELLVLDTGSLALFSVIGFAAGFRDKVFLELIARVLKVIFASEDGTTSAVDFAVDKDRLEFTAPVGSSQELLLRVTSRGSEAPNFDADSLTVDGSDAAAFAAQLTPSGAELGAAHRDIAVTFAPTRTGSFEARLVIRLGDVERAVRLEGSAS